MNMDGLIIDLDNLTEHHNLEKHRSYSSYATKQELNELVDIVGQSNTIVESI